MKIRLENGNLARVLCAIAADITRRENDWGSDPHHAGQFQHINAEVVRRPIMQVIGPAVMDNRAILRASFE